MSAEDDAPHGRRVWGTAYELRLAKGDFLLVDGRWRRLVAFGEHSLSGWPRYYTEDGGMYVKQGPVTAILTEEGDVHR